MAKPFPTFDLSRTPTPSSWSEELVTDPTIRSTFESGTVLTRARYTTTPRKISFAYNLLTEADRDLIVDFEQHVKVGADKFEFRNPITNEDWEMRLLSPVRISVEPKLPSRYRAELELFGKEIEKMRVEHVHVEDLGAGSDISNRPIFVNPKAVTLNSIGILTEGSPAGIDDSNTAVVLVKNEDEDTVVSKTYNTANQPPDADYEDLGTLTNPALAAGEHLTLSVTQGTTANMPAFSLVLEYYYT